MKSPNILKIQINLTHAVVPLQSDHDINTEIQRSHYEKIDTKLKKHFKNVKIFREL